MPLLCRPSGVPSFFFQHVQGGDLDPQQLGDRLVGVGVAVVGELAHLGEHAAVVLPARQDVLGQLLLVGADGTSNGQ